jgi:glycosyltransferase involved in cell wall biosynthesis
MPLVIVGDTMGDARYGTYLRQLADHRVHFLGFVYGLEARQLFANCAVYVQPSAMEGNSPSLLSAMACGRRIIVSDIRQNVETIGEAGFTFRTGDHVDLAQTLREVLSSSDQAETVGHAARNRVRALFDWEVHVNQVESIYLAYVR